MKPICILRKIIVIYFFFSKILGQTITIVDSFTQEPLENVNVFFENTGTTTDKLGLCALDDFQDDDLISFNLIGYVNITILKQDVPQRLCMENEIIQVDIVNVFGKGKKSKRKYKKLERDVRRVYPYAKIISQILPRYESILDSVNHLSLFERYKKKREIFSSIENELISKYGVPIMRLTKNQGRILIKLIDRETQKSSYNIIRDFRSFFHAGFWQFTARIFGHDLKKKYNTMNKEDKMIENIIMGIENKKKYRMRSNIYNF